MNIGLHMCSEEHMLFDFFIIPEYIQRCIFHTSSKGTGMDGEWRGECECTSDWSLQAANDQQKCRPSRGQNPYMPANRHKWVESILEGRESALRFTIPSSGSQCVQERANSSIISILRLPWVVWFLWDKYVDDTLSSVRIAHLFAWQSLCMLCVVSTGDELMASVCVTQS